jgi:hypothetical protein
MPPHHCRTDICNRNCDINVVHAAPPKTLAISVLVEAIH